MKLENSKVLRKNRILGDYKPRNKGAVILSNALVVL